MEDTETFALIYGEYPQFNAEEFLRSSYVDLLSSLERDVIKADQGKPNQLWKNLVNFIILIEEFVFSSAHRDSKGERWADYLLVLKVLDVFDYSIRPPDNSHLTGIEISSGKGKGILLIKPLVYLAIDIFTTILRLTLLTFQEAFAYYYRKGGSENEMVEQQSSPDMEKLFYKNVQRVRYLLAPLMQPTQNNFGKIEEGTKKLMWTLACI